MPRRVAASCFVSFRSHRLSGIALLRAGAIAAVSIVALLCLPAPAHAWGCEGHQVVALLAEMHLTPHALEMAKQILADGPIDPNLSRFCKQGGADPLADASTWPDDIRGQRPETAPWHYVDVPLGTTQRDVEKFCDPKEGCVTRAILDQLAILREEKSDPQKRADALRFLIHFVGDLHQPLARLDQQRRGRQLRSGRFLCPRAAVAKSANGKLCAEPARRVGHQHPGKSHRRPNRGAARGGSESIVSGENVRLARGAGRRRWLGLGKLSACAEKSVRKIAGGHSGRDSAAGQVLHRRQSHFRANAAATRTPW